MTPLLRKWKDVRHSFTHTPQAVRLVWQTNRWATIGLGFLTLAGALLPASQAWVGKLIVDGVVVSIQKGGDPEQIKTIFIYLIVELGLFLLSTVLNHARPLVQNAGRGIPVMTRKRMKSEGEGLSEG